MTTDRTLGPQELNILRRLERLPMTWEQWKLLLMGGMGLTFESVDVAIVGFILPVVIPLFSLTNAQTGVLGSASIIGYMIGAFFAGTLGDIIGRKKVMMYALFVFAAFTLFAACAPNWPFLFWMRALAGIGLGAEAIIVGPFISEFVPGNKRGRYIGFLTSFFGLGFVIAALLGVTIVPASPMGWRIIQVIAFLPVLMLLWWRRALLESPRYLIQRGRSAEAEEIVAGLELKVAQRIGRELPSPDTVVIPANATRQKGSILQNLAALWRPGMVRTTSMLWIAYFATSFTYYGFITWIPTLLVKQGLTVSKSFMSTFIMYLAMVPGYLSAALLNEVLGRKWTIVFYMLGCGVSAGFLANAHQEGVYTLCAFFLSFFMNGIYAGTYTYASEVYPTTFRTTGVGMALSFGRIGAISAPIIIGFAYAEIGFGGVFALMAGLLFLGALFVAILGLNTTGKTLEQISTETETGQLGQTGATVATSAHGR